MYLSILSTGKILSSNKMPSSVTNTVCDLEELTTRNSQIHCTDIVRQSVKQSYTLVRHNIKTTCWF